MAKLVREIMNQEVFSLRPEEPAEQALTWIVMMGITGAPVVDRDQRVVGHASFRDLLTRRKGSLVCDRMTTPVEVVSPSTTIDEAGRQMSRLGVHRLVVTEETRAVGVVSALDVMSALLGMPVAHPPPFPHLESFGKLRFRAEAVANEGDPGRPLEELKEASQRWPSSAFHCETEHGVAKAATHADP